MENLQEGLSWARDPKLIREIANLFSDYADWAENNLPHLDAWENKAKNKDTPADERLDLFRTLTEAYQRRTKFLVEAVLLLGIPVDVGEPRF